MSIFNRLRGRHPLAMPDKFLPLADYNAEVSGGIVHTAEMVEQMAALQAEFNQWRDEVLIPAIKAGR